MYWEELGYISSFKRNRKIQIQQGFAGIKSTNHKILEKFFFYLG